MATPSQQELEILFSAPKPEADKLAVDFLKKAPTEDQAIMGTEELTAARNLLLPGSFLLVWTRPAPKLPKDKKVPWMLWVGKCSQAVVPKTRTQQKKYPWVVFKLLGNGEVPSTEELPFPLDGFFDEGLTVYNYTGLIIPRPRELSPEPNPPIPVLRAPSMKQAAEMPDDEDTEQYDVHQQIRARDHSISSVNVCSMEYGLDIETGWLEFIQGDPAANEMRFNSWSIWLDRNFGGFGERLASDPKDIQTVDFARKQVQEAAKLYLVSEGGSASYEKEWCAKVNENINILITWYRVKHHGLLASVARQSIKNFKTDPFPEKFEQHHKDQMIEIRTRQFLEGGDPSLYHQSKADRRRMAAARLGHPITAKSEEDQPRTPPPKPAGPKKVPTSPHAPTGAVPSVPPPKPSGKGKQGSN